MAHSSIALIYGTDTNNTEEVGHKIAKQWEELGEQIDLLNIKDIELSQLEQYSMLILGIPTWDFGAYNLTGKTSEIV
ncbi:flavodoxin domain-containing protein [Marinomonas primoryensis]|uniref:flavodoxin domain-containing protein n=1 Tax=Marinomonas primoryensis TaxID=178399 RepID=UPI0026B7977F